MSKRRKLLMAAQCSKIFSGELLKISIIGQQLTAAENTDARCMQRPADITRGLCQRLSYFASPASAVDRDISSQLTTNYEAVETAENHKNLTIVNIAPRRQSNPHILTFRLPITIAITLLGSGELLVESFLPLCPSFWTGILQLVFLLMFPRYERMSSI